MGDVGDAFNGMKLQSKERRALNRTQSTKLLIDAHVSFTSHNLGAHLVLGSHVHGDIDFWPGTGKFYVRDTRKSGRGVFKVIKLCLRKN